MFRISRTKLNPPEWRISVPECDVHPEQAVWCKIDRNAPPAKKTCTPQHDYCWSAGAHRSLISNPVPVQTPQKRHAPECRYALRKQICSVRFYRIRNNINLFCGAFDGDE